MLINEEILSKLNASKNEKFRSFQIKLIPNVDIERVIGVKNPEVRKIAKEYIRNDQIDSYLDDLPHFYFEENILHSYLLNEIKDYEKAIKLLDAFLPYVDNWAVCDILNPKAFKKNKDLLRLQIKKYISSEKAYTVRFGIEMAMTYFLGDDFDEDLMLSISEIRSDEYYVNMMKAWYFATALAKNNDIALKYIENRSLDTWSHNKAIQKSVESYRISDDMKAYLKTLKIKK